MDISDVLFFYILKSAFLVAKTIPANFGCLLFKIMKNGYPTHMIARNSPKNTQANMMKYNSTVKFITASVPTEDKYIIAGTIAAFTKQGIKPFKNNSFTNLDKTIINKHAINVAPVPIRISNGPTVENRFANKQPKVNPTI